MTWHIISSEYPPLIGGVSDYTYMVASELAIAGDVVHVWCPPVAGEVDKNSDVIVHRRLGSFGLKDWRRVGRLLDGFTAPRRLLVQWVPHGYGYRSMNLPFCFWLWKRALLKQDRVEVMIHEPFLTFSGRSWKQSGAAAVHRLMMIVLLNAASHVWMSIPGWKKLLKPYALGRKIPFDWLPVSNNIPVIDDPCGVQELRVRHAPAGELIIGHFGTYGQHITDLLIKSLPAIMRHSSECVLVLLGRGGTGVRQELARRYPDLSHRMHAPGELSASDLSRHISACDLLFQPYPDGISSRRTSAMVGLAHGLPLVTTSGHLTESLWLDSDAVAIAPVEEISGLIAAAEKLLRDKKKREDLGSSAKKLYQERFDVSHTVALLRGSSTPVADGSSTNLLLQH